MKLGYLLLSMLMLVACQSQQVSEEQSTADTNQDYYQNPILAGWYPDPAITDDGNGNFYMVHSTFAFYPGIPIFHSTDLVNWKQIGHVLDRPSQLELEGFGVSRGIFAPDISYHDGTYYVTCTVVDGQGNFVVTATDPAGPWTDPVWLPEVSGIDPGLFFDEDGSAYLVYNSEAPDNKPLYQGHRTIRMYAFDKENLQVTGENRILVNGGVDISQKPIWAEGPRIYKLNGYYYLMTAEGGTAIDHSEVIYRTRDINDEFIPWDQNPILTQRHLDPDREHPITSAGHADIVQHPNGDWYGIFLACRAYGDDYYNTGRETFLTPVRWEDDWPVFDLGGEAIKYRYPLPEGTEIKEDYFPLNGNFQVRETFEEDELPYHWMFLRTVREPWHEMNVDGGGLSMQTRPETLSGKSNPSFIGRRQQHLQGSAAISLDFTPASDNESAGLVAFQNETHYYYLAKKLMDGQPVVALLKAGEGSEEEVLAQKEVPANGPIRLSIEADTDEYHFYMATEDGEWQPVAENVDGKYLSTRVARGFVGVTLAMHTTSNGEPSDNEAVFNWFEYEGHDDVYENSDSQTASIQPMKSSSEQGLKDYYSAYFPMGVAVSPRALADPAQSALIRQEFNSMTPENVMKMGPIHPGQDRYNWGPADKVAEFAEENDLKLRGHALVWHQQYPDWFFEDSEGNRIGKDTLYARMKRHITDVVTRYKDHIYAWDVVNEAVSDNSNYVYRQESPFYQIAGEEYLAKAFEFAHEADPEAKLFYNDYNAVRPEKVERIYQLVKKLVDAGVPIHGVGIQGHWSIYEPSREELTAAIEKYSSLGLEVQITELDVSIYKWEKERRPRREGESDEYTPELQEKQAEQYTMFFDVFREYRDVLTGVTFWNISDKYSWLDYYPVEGRKNYPLLFDQEHKRKDVYYDVVKFENE